VIEPNPTGSSWRSPSGVGAGKIRVCTAASLIASNATSVANVEKWRSERTRPRHR